jgi:hypothetical protein
VRNDRGHVAQRVVEMVWSERRELNALAGNRPHRRPVSTDTLIVVVALTVSSIMADGFRFL